MTKIKEGARNTNVNVKLWHCMDYFVCSSFDGHGNWWHWQIGRKTPWRIHWSFQFWCVHWLMKCTLIVSTGSQDNKTKCAMTLFSMFGNKSLNQIWQFFTPREMQGMTCFFSTQKYLKQQATALTAVTSQPCSNLPSVLQIIKVPKKSL